MKSLNGYKTYIGIAIAFLGLIGYGDLITEGEASQLIDLLSQVFGLLVAMYGRWHATYRMNKVQ